MAIVYPLTPPASLKFSNMAWQPETVVGETRSPTTFQAQTFVWPGQRWTVRCSVPPLKNFTGAAADEVVAFLLSLNGKEGTFLLGDRSRLTTRGTANGAWLVGAANVADSTTLITQAGAGQFALADWLQISTYLHRVTKVVDATHYDLFPRLRTAYANGTAITYTNPKGVFKLAENTGMAFNIDTAKYHGVELNCVEAQ